MSGKNAIFRADEAAQMQCCGPEGTGMFNDAPFPARWCVSSSCMAWRWYYTNIPGPDGNLIGNGETYGYCGLAGAPALRTTP